jgi:Uma2 family endonuclease
MVALQKRSPARMTVDEFLVWDPAAAPRGAIQAELGRLLANHLAERASPCRVIAAPGIVPRVRANENFRVPDLGVTCAPPSREVMVPEPVLLIEILSPSNEPETRANVWTYTTIPSVQEILLVSSTRVEAELLRRGRDGARPTCWN